MDKELEIEATKGSTAGRASQISIVQVGRENLSDALAPHESYEGRHRYDPGATWTEQEERRVVWKTDLYLLSWICVMVRIIAVLKSMIYLIFTVFGSSIGPRESLKCIGR
jgi:hypothetical protein